MVPVTREQSVAHGAATQWKTHVWAAIVDGKEVSVVGEHGDEVATCADHRTATLLELGHRADANSFSGDDIH